MHWIDITIFIIYFLLMLSVGIYFFMKNKSTEDYYVGGRQMKAAHIGLSVVATDVGGGFSIGLGGLGFGMGLSGSWMLFTGLIGAWLTAVVLIPKVSALSHKHKFLTFPQLFGHFYNKKVSLVAAIISTIGYIGFTSSQLLAGAKLTDATFTGIDQSTALILMGIVVIVYTSFGGLKAVIYTDTIQWAILIAGLIFIGIPMGYIAIGGLNAIHKTLGPEFLSLSNVSWNTLVNWAVTIIPIWFVGMTLYQRIYAARDIKQAKRAWYIAGIMEWPLMAFMGVTLGLFARVAFEQGLFTSAGYTPEMRIDDEMGLPILLNSILPIGVLGLMLSAYFSAILSTADSCLMAASGNMHTDILERFGFLKKHTGAKLRISQILTFIIGVISVVLASTMTNVLSLMLYSYAFMVSGLFVPILIGLYTRNPDPKAVLWAMILGGLTTVSLSMTGTALPLKLDANVFGISMSALTYFTIKIVRRRNYI